MRDPDRIPKVLKALGAVWQHNPDWRLGQVLNMACAWADADLDALVLLEDERLLDGLERLEVELSTTRGR